MVDLIILLIITAIPAFHDLRRDDEIIDFYRKNGGGMPGVSDVEILKIQQEALPRPMFLMLFSRILVIGWIAYGFYNFPWQKMIGISLFAMMFSKIIETVISRIFREQKRGNFYNEVLITMIRFFSIIAAPLVFLASR